MSDFVAFNGKTSVSFIAIPEREYERIKAENEQLRTRWQDEHTERIRLEERLKWANTRLEYALSLNGGGTNEL